MEKAGSNILGVILNKAKVDKSSVIITIMEMNKYD